MAKQGFMGKISRWFSGSSDTYFFGVQLAIKCFGEDTLRAKFARVLEEAHESGDGVQEKRRFIRRFVALMEESELFWNSGFWDYYERADEATDEFHTWVHEIEAPWRPKKRQWAMNSTTSSGFPTARTLSW